MEIRHYLYNAFLVEADGAKIAIDPGQNLWLFALRSLIPEAEWADVTHILVTHGDPDHYWQADRLARASGAPLVCGRGLTRTVNGEMQLVHPRGRGLRSWIALENVHPLEVGESITLGGVSVEAVTATHGPIAIKVFGRTLRQKPAPDERVGIGSVAFRVTVGGTTFLNLGDSILQPEWEGVETDVLMLPIGGLGSDTWTMDVPEALDAVRIIRPSLVIPCHYSVPFLWTRRFARADDQAFKRAVERMGIECRVLGGGDAISF